MSHFSRDFFQSYKDAPAKNNNMFFIRHAAHPRNLKFLTGIDGTMVCSIKEDNYTLPDDMKKYLKNTLYETVLSPQLKYDKFSFPKTLNETTPLDTELKWSPELMSLGKKIGIRTNDESNKFPMFKRTGNNEMARSQNFDFKSMRRNSKRSLNLDQNKNSDYKLESQSLFMLKPTKDNKETDKLSSNSLILPKIKTLKLESSEALDKQTNIDRIIIKNLKVRSINDREDMNYANANEKRVNLEKSNLPKTNTFL
ncbi:unnamed protein product [Brachionus calyciflorus]|uniref:Uncharacterized protein n=1 Tax=Brachionus calyciflorus TaxID=104777 RepID=A0A814MBD4_9BILA|nr:unnamed protein product [Brachionus calyciflorus]